MKNKSVAQVREEILDGLDMDDWGWIPAAIDQMATAVRQETIEEAKNIMYSRQYEE
jgi:hypothetical protein